MPKALLSFLFLSLPLSAQLPAAPRHTIEAEVTLRDHSHPKHAGDFHEQRLKLTIAADTDRDALALTFRSGQEPPDRFVLRGAALFHVNAAALEPADSAGDLRPLTLAKLDPLYVAALLVEKRENAQRTAANTIVFAHGDELWSLQTDGRGDVTSVRTGVVHDLYGDLVETVTYERWSDRGGVRFPARITVQEGDRMKATLDVTSVRAGAEDDLLRQSRAGKHSVYDEDISFRELAPHVFAIELKPTDSRVFVAEFEDHLVVIEGAYDDRNVSRIARRIRARFPKKPIRYFSFSHIHGQYIGGVRTYVSGGATVITTPSGAEVVKQIAASRHGRSGPMAVTTSIVEKSRTFEDATNAMTVLNVDSQHTDDYFVFYFPRAKLLVAGDLLCYRGPETPLRGRSKNLCATLKSLGLEIEQITVSWPLEGYGCLSPVIIEDFKRACEK
jgi:glyoxylase-like metal-dependent hydrolase (beta-lactamase superfamily II)